MLNIFETIQDRSPFDEHALIAENEFIHVWAQSVGQQLAEELGKAIDQANWAEVPQRLGVRLLGN